MEENTVMNIAEPIETAPVDAGQGESIAELLGVEQQQEPVETVTQEGVDGQEQVAQPDQKDIGAAFAKERARLEAKFQRDYEAKMASDPYYAFGRQMLDYIAKSQGLSMQDAAAFANNQYIQAIAQAENVSPNVARMLYEREATKPQMPDINGRAERIKAELPDINMPEGFDFAEAIKDEAFAEMLLKYPTEAAIEVYHAKQQAKNAPAVMAEQLKARAAIPQAMKPQQPVTPQIDFASMTDDEFFEFEAKMKG